MKRLIFLVGVGRSGTTLLMSMLNAHQEICFPPETIMLKNYLCNPSLHKKLKSDVNNVFTILDNDLTCQRLNIDFLEIKNKVEDISQLYMQALQIYAMNNNKPILGDKYPRNLEHLAEIQYLFPKSLVINIVRDPRDVITSRRKTSWGMKRNFLSHICITRVMRKIASNKGRKYFNKNFYELTYETLLSYPADSLKKICSFLNIEYDQTMLDFQTSASKIIQNNELDFKSNNMKPLLSDNKDKWKKELNFAQVALIEAGCHQTMKLYNYEKKFPWLSFILRPFNIVYLAFEFLFLSYQKIKFFQLRKYNTFNKKCMQHDV